MLHRKIAIRKVVFMQLFCMTTTVGWTQTVLSLDSCRAMALRNNKQIRVAEVRRDVAANVRKAARTKYLPHVSAVGGYEHTSREISLLSDAQKSALGGTWERDWRESCRAASPVTRRCCPRPCSSSWAQT